MARRTGTEFLEVFRRVPDKGAGDAGHPRGGRTGVFGSAKRIEISLGYESLLIGGFILIAALVAAHVWGLRRGRAAAREMALHASDLPAVAHTRSETPPSRKPIAAAAREPVSPESAVSGTLSLSTSQKAVPFWTVRIVGGIDLRSAKSLRDNLRQAGYEADVLRPPGESGYAIIVGRFSSRTDPAAIAAKEKLISLQDRRGNRPYRGAYVVQITDARSIIP